MSQLCKICLLPRKTRDAIDKHLYRGTTYRKIVEQFSTKERRFTVYGICRHRRHLMPQDIVRRPPPPDPNVRKPLIDRIEAMIAEFREIAESTRRDQPAWAIAAMKEIMRGLEMIGKITGEVPTGAAVNLNFTNGNLSAEQFTTFFDGIKKRGAEAHFVRLVHQYFPNTMPSAPVINVNFRKGNETPPTIDAPAPAPALEAPSV